MFPTKALAQDQRSAIQNLLDAAFPGNAPALDVYDGDTPQSVRPSIRERARLLVTNPDMLHVSILPSHASFERFLCNLRYVVVDESHMCGFLLFRPWSCECLCCTFRNFHLWNTYPILSVTSKCALHTMNMKGMNEVVDSALP